MSYASATEAQKVEATRQLTNAAKAVYTAVSGGQHLDSTELDTVMGLAATALTAMGATGLGTNQVTITQGNSIQIKDGSGASDTGTVLVSSGTGAAQLSATSAIAKNGATLAVTGGTVTLHVASGVLTATYAAS